MYRKFVGGLFAGSLLFTACGGADAPIAAPVDAAAPAATVAAAAPAETVAPAAAADTATIAVVTVGQTEVGEALVGERGLTLYGFLNDTAAASVCTGTCAEAWPPLIVPANWGVAPGLDAGIFNTTTRDDGTLQLVAGKWPLYYFGGDLSSGEINGQASGDVWFVAGSDGRLLDGTETATEEPAAAEPAAAALASVATGELGDQLVDAAGLSLYGFLDDKDGIPVCEDACADAWPPIFVDSPQLPEGLDPAIFSVATRSDGTYQLSAGVWPLYLFAGDGAPGDTNGQGSGDVWFLINPQGGLIKDGAVAAPAESDGGSSLYDD